MPPALRTCNEGEFPGFFPHPLKEVPVACFEPAIGFGKFLFVVGVPNTLPEYVSQLCEGIEISGKPLKRQSNALLLT